MTPPSRRRRLFALVILACLAAAGCSTWLMVFQLPHPRSANRDQLLRWLVLRDVANESEEIQIALIDRIEEELLAGIEIDDGDQTVSRKYVDRLNANSIQLQSVWFHRRVIDYANCKPDQRIGFLQRQIQVVAQWSVLQGQIYKWWDKSDLNPSEYQEKSVVEFFDQIDAWMSAQTGERRAQMVKAVQDSVICWLAERDLTEQSVNVRRQLADRIAASLGQQDGLLASGPELDDAQQQVLTRNAALLFEAWFHSQADKVAALEADRRPPYIDGVMDDVMQWGVLELLSPLSAGSASTTKGLLHLQTQIDGWIQRAEEETRPRLQQLKTLVQQRVLIRQLKQMKLPRFFRSSGS